MGTRAFVALLVAIVVLFVVVEAVGTRRRAGDATAQNDGFVATLMRSASSQSEVPLRDLSASCLQPNGMLTVHVRCELKVAASNDKLRTVRLTALGNAVVVTAHVPDPKGGSGRELSKKVSSGDALKVAVGKDGSVIVLSCLPDCQLRAAG